MPPKKPPAHSSNIQQPPTSPSFQLDNLNNRLSGTLALLTAGYAALRELRAQLSQRAARRRRLVADPDRKDRANKDARVFALDMAGLAARKAELEEALRAWERDVRALTRMVGTAEMRARVE